MIRTSRVDELTPPGDHMVFVRFHDSRDRIQELNLDRIDPNASCEDGVHRLRTGSRLIEVLGLLAAHGAEDVTIRKPTVEELFMDDYRTEGEKRI